MQIGVLALQGAFIEHEQMLAIFQKENDVLIAVAKSFMP